MRIIIFTPLIILIGIFLGACGSGRSSDTRLMIRIRNDSVFDIDNFWLGAGPEGGATQDTAYGAIAQGSVTNYYAIEPVLANYRKMNMVIDGTRYHGIIDPAQYVNQPELKPGWYTFAYDLVQGNPVLTLLSDPPQ